MLTLLQPFNLDSSKDYTFANTTLGNLATANYYTGNGSLLSGIVASSANTAATVTTAAQPNITSVGTLTSLSVTGNVSANYFIGDGSLLTNINAGNITGAYSNTNVASYLPTYTGNISANYFIGNGSTLSSITGSNVSGNVDLAITSNWANTANSVSGTNVSGNVTSAVQSHYANIANSVSGTNVSGQVSNALIAGTVYTASQPNITSVGTLLGLNVTGNLDITGNINATGNLNYSNVTDLVVGDPLIYLGANNTGNLYDLGIVASYNDGTYYHTGLARDASDGTWKLFDTVVAEPTTTIDFANGTYAPFRTGSFTSTGNVSANYFIGNGSTLTSVAGANVTGYVPNATAANTATTAGTVTTAAQPNITSVGTLTALTVSGLITATGTGIKTANIQDSTGTITITTRYGNVSGDVGVYGNITAGTSGTGNVTATYFIGDGSQLTGIASGGATITDNTSANTTYYPVYATSSTGSFTTAGITTTKLQFNPSSGQLTVQDLNTLSDATLKTNQEVIDDPFTVLNQIFGMGFNWLDSGKKSYGLMAQMLEKILPELVSENAQGKKTVNYIPIIAFLIEAVKKNQAEIEELKKDKYL